MTFVALLRGVNVGGRTMLSMMRLQQLLSELGFANARTLLQSGNAVFDTGRTPTARLENLLDREIRSRLSFETEFFVRSAAEWEAIVTANPFTAEAKADPSRLVMYCLKQAPAAGAVKAMRAAIVGREVVEARERQLYAYFPDGQGRSKLTGGSIEKLLATRGTARNWNTVLKIAALTRAA